VAGGSDFSNASPKPTKKHWEVDAVLEGSSLAALVAPSKNLTESFTGF